MKIYQVGGAVRDQLMGKEPNDVDYVVIGANPQKMLDLGFVEVGKGFPVFLHPQSKEEYALARKEIKTGPKHTDFKFIFDESISLREDLERRDFTCNAIAYDEQSKTYIDFFGGREDIQNRLLRHINAGHFVEDPLRVLRMCRFAAQLNFAVAADTLQLCRQMVSEGMLAFLTPERAWHEVLKALKTPDFYLFIERARQVGALKEIMPQVDQMWQVPENSAYHPEGTTGGHVVSALKTAAHDSPLVKFGVLLHDVGKVLTPLAELPSHRSHETRAKELIDSVCQRLKVPVRFQAFANMAAAQHMKFYHIDKMKPGTLFDLAKAMTIGQVCYVEEFIAVCRADFESTYHAEQGNARQAFAQKAKILKFAAAAINNISASQMPNFAQLPKDENFKRVLREYKIEILTPQLRDFKRSIDKKSEQQEN